MKVLVTGAHGFVGKNLCAALDNLKSRKDRTHPELFIEEVYEITRESSHEELMQACANADFVFHFAGINRPKDETEFMRGNYGFTGVLLDSLKEQHNCCPVMAASSIQASLLGRYAKSGYGISKLTMEKLLFEYEAETGAEVLVYRFANLFGKWSRPNYNSAVATFCYNIAHDLPIQVNDPATELELIYIDDLIQEMLNALKGNPHRCMCQGVQVFPDPQGKYCYVPVSHHVTLGYITELLYQYKGFSQSLMMPEIPEGSFEKKLYSTYLSFLPKEAVLFDMKMNQDHRGSFTELLKTKSNGQFSVNVSKPSITKGQHWHHSKWELFIVVSGHGLIQQRRIDSDEILEFEVSGEKIQAVYMLPGFTHNIINLSETEDLVTVMWANECFDSMHPDTYAKEVSQ